MATSQVFTSKNLNGNDIINVGKIQVNLDASDASELVRKSQVESIAASSVQSQLVDNTGNASATTAYTSEFTQAALNTKQPNMSIDAASTGFLEIVDGSKIKLKSLGINTTYRDTTNATLTDFIAAATFNGDGTITIGGETLDKMTFIFLTTATLPQEKSVIYLGTNNGNETDFVKFGVNYNEGEIRSFFNSTGTGILFDANTGVFSLDIGTTASELGGQTLPHGCTFTTISPSSDIKDALLKLEALINAVDQSGADGTAALTTRINNLTGTTGNNYGTFTGSSFADNQSGKQLFQASETLHESATSDRAAIRTEFTTADSGLQSNIDSEAATRLSNDNTLQANIDTEAATRASADAGLQTDITNEAITRSSADTTLQNNIDAEETSRIAAINAEITARTNADTAETNARIVADDALQNQINALADSNIELAGTVDESGVFTSVDGVADSRNGQQFTSIAMKAGEEVVFSADVTLLENDFKTNDKLMVKVSTITAGNMQLSDFVYKKGDGSDITRANLDNVTIKLDGSEKLVVTPDSISRTHLAQTVEDDIDDKRSLTQPNAATSDGDTHFVSTTSTSAQQNIYNKREQLSSDALSGTARTVLTELHVHTNGSGDPALPSYAHATTVSTHYQGSSTDMSVVIAGGNFEGNGKTGTATQATGIYGTATKDQLGINVGGTFVADNATVSNIGVFGFADTDGAGKDRGGVFAVSDLDFISYVGYRTASPIPELDAAVIADAESATNSKALVAIGDSVFRGGVVTVPSSVNDTDAVNLGDIRGKQRIFEFDLSDGVSKTITVSGVNLDAAIIQTTDNNQSVDVSVVRDSINNEVTVTATGGDLTGVRLLVQELSCDVTQV